MSLPDYHQQQIEEFDWPTHPSWLIAPGQTPDATTAETLPLEGVVMVDENLPDLPERLFVCTHERVHIHIGAALRHSILGDKFDGTIDALHRIIRTNVESGSPLPDVDQEIISEGFYKDMIDDYNFPERLTLQGIGRFAREYMQGVEKGTLRDFFDPSRLSLLLLTSQPSGLPETTPIKPGEDTELFATAVMTGTKILTGALDRMRNAMSAQLGVELHTFEEGLANWVAARFLEVPVESAHLIAPQDYHKYEVANRIEAIAGTSDPGSLLGEVTDYQSMSKLAERVIL